MYVKLTSVKLKNKPTPPVILKAEWISNLRATKHELQTHFSCVNVLLGFGAPLQHGTSGWL